MRTGISTTLAIGSLAAALCLLFASAHVLRAADAPASAAPDPMAKADPHAQAPANAPGDTADDEESLPKAKLTGEMDFNAAEMIAIQEGGRKKPLHTYAYEKIEQLVGKPMFPFGVTPYLKDIDSGEKIYAPDLFFSILFHTRDWEKVPVVLIAYGPLLDQMNLPRSEKHFSKQQIEKSEVYKGLMKGALEKRHKGLDKELTDMEQEAEVVSKRIDIVVEIYRGLGTLCLIPHPTDVKGAWISFGELSESQNNPASDARQYYTKDQSKKVFAALRDMAVKYRERDASGFTEASRQVKSELLNLSPTVYPTYDVLDREVTYNNLRPFGWAWVFYLFAATAGMVLFRFKSKALYGLVFALASTGLAFHVYGFVLRCLIAGRPPVSNMYESVVWVGFGAVFFSMVFEVIYRKKYFMICGATAGFACLVLMDMLPILTGNSDTPGFKQNIAPLVPVLRNNFWLTIHVLTITLSYAAFMLTCVLGHVTLFRHLFNPGAKDVHRELHTYVYRTMQVGVLLIACGTILGGVWAYYSWGRFWGWDPKETWAFITLMCYLVVLHGRFTGWWGNFGLSLGSVICFNSVLFAWYGVNFVLGTGLHSYGFGAGSAGWKYMLTFVVGDLLFAGIATMRHMEASKPKTDLLTDSSGADGDDDNKLTKSDPVEEVRAIGTDDNVGTPLPN